MDAFFVWLTTWFRKLTGQASKEPEAAVVEEPATAKEPAIAKADVNGEPLKKPPLASSGLAGTKKKKFIHCDIDADKPQRVLFAY